ncbi:MAG: glycosyltransferase [bacterium]|nr:glycosyltransferase [bacterium]
MNINFVSPSFFPSTFYGGPIYSTLELAKVLNKQGVGVLVITTNANGNEKLKIKTGVFHKLDNELSVKYYKSLDSRGTSLSMLFNLYKELKSSNIVYLVSIFSAPTPFTIFISRLLKKPLIIAPKGQLGKWCLEQGNPFKKLWLHTFIQPYIKHLHWHLASTAEEQAVLAVYPSAKTFVIPNGVSPDLFQLNEKKKDKTFFNKYCGFDCSNKKIIVSMGRLHEVKGFDILIEAISKVLKEAKDKGKSEDIVLLIAGEDFGEKKKLEQLIDKLGLKEKVFLIGRIEGSEKIEFLRNADVFALASHHENFGMSYAEALAAETPVAASTNTPWQEVQIHNCGKWVENTPEKFADAINEILESDPAQMGKNGSQFIMDNFSWEKLSKQILENLERLVYAK